MISVLSRSFAVIYAELIQSPDPKAVGLLAKSREAGQITYPEYCYLVYRVVLNLLNEELDTDPVIKDIETRWDARSNELGDLEFEEANDPLWNSIDEEQQVWYRQTKCRLFRACGDAQLADLFEHNYLAFTALEDEGERTIKKDQRVLQADALHPILDKSSKRIA
ncbi:MAG: hypothetical protein BGO01_20540 [Armatimonadetes bacterium 55-13]|nr:hypothetical protein [Armatimonadota bacterium]OJU64500.1 MAG: hypothetical protein BGO01_20540 [Armatimonadetes bacterium 55-13]